MDKSYYSILEIDDLLRGDLSDIEELEDVDLDDELEQIVTEEQLHEQIQEFEEHLVEDGIRISEEASVDTLDNGETAPDNGETAPNNGETAPVNDETVPNIGEVQANENQVGPEPITNNEIDVDEVPIFNRLTKKEQAAWRKARDISRWKNITDNHDFPIVERNVEFEHPPGVLTPKEYFKMFIDNEILDNIVYQTNLYSVQKNLNSICTNAAEIEQFLGIHMLSGVVKMPSLRMYWSNSTRFEPIAECMPRNRFELLRRMLHLNDNSNLPNAADINHDKLFKLRPFIDRVRLNMTKTQLEDTLSIDELIIPFKGRAAIKQYNPKKPHKWGIKVFALASTCGMIHDFEIYVGKGTVQEQNLGISGDIVIRLVDIVPRNENYKLFIDNWFNSHALLCKLKSEGIHTTGTVRQDRIGRCPFTDDKNFRKQGRGSFEAKIDTDNKIIACKWLDNKSVCLASTYIGPDPVSDVQRWSVNLKERIPVPRPAIIGEYNSSMGGVDLHDMLVELYRTDFKVKRYYFRVFYHIIDMCVVNSWLLYRRHSAQLDPNSKVMPLVDFKSSIAHGLIKGGENKQRKRGRPSTAQSTTPPPTTSKKYYATRPVADVRYDGFDHWPIPVGVKQRCKECIKCYSTIKCSKCDVELCLNQKRNCFVKFHRK